MSSRPQIVYGRDSVQVRNSFLIKERADIKAYVKYIKGSPDCPYVVSRRKDMSLVREWEAHNFLFAYGVRPAQTKDVDFVDEPLRRRICYCLLSILYRIGIY